MGFKIPITINNSIYFKFLPTFVTNKLNLNFGYIPHSDEKTNIKKSDVCFSRSLISISGTTSDTISLKHYFKEISNQYNLSSCVANGIADTAEAMYAKEFKKNPAIVPDFSRLFIYYNARNNQTPPASHEDSGTYIGIGMDSISRYGITQESVWPYITSNVFTRPSIIAYKTALKNRFFNYYSINSKGDDRIRDITKALNAGCPVIFGTKVDSAFTNPTGLSLVGPPSGDYVGGHCLVVVGKKGNNFEIRNSWGAGWRNNGYVWFTPEYLKASITKDIWVLVKK
ncbi:MAG TPA: C1 family peptidase [Candidatus Glassbacteria bacterium]|nr:C1 family peptidase [Candidatus Glassbacteria bacterium]